MREIADKFAGGIEQIDAHLPAGKRRLTGRAVLIGLAGVILVSVAEPYNQNVFTNTMLIGNQFPVAVLSFILGLVLIVNPVLTMLPAARSPFDAARLAVVWAFLLPASLWAWHGPTEPGSHSAAVSGFAGPVVGLVWSLTGAILLMAALVARRRAPRRPSPLAREVALGVMCVLPVLLAPLLSRCLDESRADAVGRWLLSYLTATVVMMVLGRWAARGLRRVPPLAPAELVVIMTMMLSACAVIWSGFHRLWAHQLVAPFYYLQAYPRWQPLVRSLPAWLVPSADPDNKEVIYNFFAGGAQVPWGPWSMTAVRWAPFVLAFFIGTFCLVAVFRRQWEEAEKLSFPLAAISLEMFKPPRPGLLLNDLFRSKLFWWSMGIVVCLQMLYGLHAYYPAFPEIVFKYDLHPAMETPPWRYLPVWIKAKDAFFVAIGVAFFLSTEMSFSLWASVVILALVEMIGKNYQYPIHEQFNDHQIGAYLAYTVVIVWVARRHLTRVLRSIWRPARAMGPSQLGGMGSLSARALADQPPVPPDAEGDSDHVSERNAAIGFIVCFVVATLWLKVAGLPILLALLVAVIIFMLALVIGRVVAESGLVFVQYNCWPHRIAESVFSPLLTPASHTLIHFTTVAPTLDAREALAPYAFNSARMADGVRHLNRRGLFGLWIGSLVLGLLLAGAAQLKIVYQRGATQTDEHAGKLTPERLYNSSADFADSVHQSPEKTRADRLSHGRHVAVGGAVVLGLCFLRYRFLAWPLHPIGFLMANTYPMQVFWLSIMIAWLCKTLVMRLGGIPVYRKLCPLFLGMIVGTTLSSIFWILVKIASYSGGEQGRAILFLPS